MLFCSGCGCFFVFMIVFCWNVRGLRRLAKRVAVRRLVRLQKVDLLCLQETKVYKDVERIVFDVWGSRTCSWEWVPLEGASRGLISIWNEEILNSVDVFSSPRVLATKFKSVADNFKCAVANIYGQMKIQRGEIFGVFFPWCATNGTCRGVLEGTLI